MKRFALFFLFFVFAIFSCFSQVVYNNEDAGFSYSIPDEWKLADFPGMKYKIAFGENLEGFSSNMNIVDEVFAGSLDQYIEGTKKAFAQYFGEYKLEKELDFKSTSGIVGKKLIVLNTQQNLNLRQIFYIFKGNGIYYVITCSVLAKNNMKFDTIFDKSMKTFVLSKKD